MSQTQSHHLLSDTSDVSDSYNKNLFKSRYFVKTGAWQIIESESPFAYDGKKGNYRKNFYTAKAKEFNEDFADAKYVTGYKMTETRISTLSVLFDCFFSNLVVGQVDAEGYVKTSFAYLSQKAGREASCFRKRLLGSVSVRNFAKNKPAKMGHLVRNNIVQIRNVIKSEECSAKNGFHYTTFEFRINPEYMAFIDDRTRQIWTELSLWKDIEIEKIDIVESPRQAAQDAKRAQAEEVRASFIEKTKSKKEEIFDYLFDKSQTFIKEYFDDQVKKLGLYATHKDHYMIVKLQLEFYEWQRQKVNPFENTVYKKRTQEQDNERLFEPQIAPDKHSNLHLQPYEQKLQMKELDEKRLGKGMQAISDIVNVNKPKPAPKKELSDRELLILQTILMSSDFDNLYGRQLSKQEHEVLNDLALLVYGKKYDAIPAWIWNVQARK